MYHTSHVLDNNYTSISIFVDLNDISDDTVKQLCTGSHVFFNCLGTTRKQAGSAVSNNVPVM